MRFFSPFRPLLRAWLFSALGWGAFYFAFGWQIVHAFSQPWAGVARGLALDALLWTVVTPLIFRLAERLPIERTRWKIALPVHVAAYLAVALGFVGLHSLGSPLGGREGPRPGRPPRAVEWIFFGPQLPIYLAFVSLAHARHFSRRARERERRELELAASLAEARLRALRMQIQPHFLFNALNALAALIPRDPDAADDMLAALADFLRLTLEDPGGREVPLGRELEFTERYLAIEKVRFGDRLTFSIDADPAALAVAVPPLLLQPLVENAVRHGIEPRREAGRIEIHARRENGALRLTVRDDGVGLPPVFAEGVGLANTRTRLRELHGDAATMELKSGDGLQIDIGLPARIA